MGTGGLLFDSLTYSNVVSRRDLVRGLLEVLLPLIIVLKTVFATLFWANPADGIISNIHNLIVSFLLVHYEVLYIIIQIIIYTLIRHILVCLNRLYIFQILLKLRLNLLLLQSHLMLAQGIWTLKNSTGTSNSIFVLLAKIIWGSSLDTIVSNASRRITTLKTLLSLINRSSIWNINTIGSLRVFIILIVFHK